MTIGDGATGYDVRAVSYTPRAGNGSYLRFRGTSAQADVAKDLTDVMSVAELGVRIGRSN